MIKLIALIFFALLNTNGLSSLDEIRALYEKASIEEESCIKLLKYCEGKSCVQQPIFIGYQGCGNMLMAKYALNPITKMSNFKKGKELLEKAIRIDSSNTELHYLRFTVQTNVPGFLGYNNAIEKDKYFLLNSLKTLSDESLKKMILNYLLSSDELTASEKQMLWKLKNT